MTRSYHAYLEHFFLTRFKDQTSGYPQEASKRALTSDSSEIRAWKSNRREGARIFYTRASYTEISRFPASRNPSKPLIYATINTITCQNHHLSHIKNIPSFEFSPKSQDRQKREKRCVWFLFATRTRGLCRGRQRRGRVRTAEGRCKPWKYRASGGSVSCLSTSGTSASTTAPPAPNVWSFSDIPRWPDQIKGSPFCFLFLFFCFLHDVVRSISLCILIIFFFYTFQLLIKKY